MVSPVGTQSLQVQGMWRSTLIPRICPTGNSDEGCSTQEDGGEGQQAKSALVSGPVGVKDLGESKGSTAEEKVNPADKDLTMTSVSWHRAAGSLCLDQLLIPLANS